MTIDKCLYSIGVSRNDGPEMVPKTIILFEKETMDSSSGPRYLINEQRILARLV
jgi:hypothetical protein